MFGRNRKRDPFWSRASSREGVVHGPASIEDIRPGSGEGWRQLWEHDATPTSSDDAQWADFVSGDATEKREVDWLLSGSR
jgi:hypothetical protein